MSTVKHMMPDHAAAAAPGTISNADPRQLVLGVIDILRDRAVLHMENRRRR